MSEEASRTDGSVAPLRVPMSDEDLTRKLVALFDEAELMGLRATFRTSGSDWRTISVREASIMEYPGENGLIVDVEDGGV